MKKYLTLISVVILISIVSILAQSEPPSAANVGTQLQNYWTTRQFSQLEDYVNNLYTNYPNYTPAILAKACYEGVYRSNLSNVVSELNRVLEANVGSDYFKALVSAEKSQTEQQLISYYERGISHATLTNAASPQAVRDVWEWWPYLELTTNAPSIFLPNN